MAKSVGNDVVTIWIVRKEENGEISMHSYPVWVRELWKPELHDIFGVLISSDLTERVVGKRNALLKVGKLMDC